MNIYQVIGAVVALILYLPLSYQILKTNNEVGQSLASFILWGGLDAIVGTSLLLQGSKNYELPFFYVGGCVLTILSILKSGKFSWTWFETFVSVLILFSLIAWYIIGWVYDNQRLAIILSTAGSILAGMPQLRDLWRKPQGSPFVIYTCSISVGVFTTIGGHAWTVEERLYPVASGVLCVAFVVLSARKFFHRSLV